jgi:hypothetical protein
VINERARMTSAAGAYADLDRFEARKRVVEDLEKLGLLVKIEPYTLAASKCQRCKHVRKDHDIPQRHDRKSVRYLEGLGVASQDHYG